MNNTPTETVIEIGQPEWAEVEAIVADKWPAAIQAGMGYWRIPRKARIFYSGANSRDGAWYATLTYAPMR